MAADYSTSPKIMERFVRTLSWFTERPVVLIIGLALICAILVLSDLIHHKHGHFSFEEWFGFFGLFGFVVYMTIVLLAKSLRSVIKRNEDYWGNKSIASEDCYQEPDLKPKGKK